ncbi:MAG: TonB-dependent siderophore receptor [Sphingobium sp.]|nr:TonB-dependent siderophore receptor [Sphingobium sp.]
MRFNPKLMAGAAICGLMLPITAFAADADEDADSARQARSDIIVIGKSYGAEVGKTVTPLKDIPNTVTVIDRGQIEAQGLFTLEDVMTATNGITVTGVGSEDPSYMSRGFAINNYLMDGVAVTSPAVMADMFFYDRIEVLRGPAGLFSGSGNPAGSLNLVRKRPLDELSVKAMAGYGSYENKRFELDVSTPLTSIGGVRAGVMVQDQDQFFDTAHRNRLAAFVTGSVELDTKTTLTFGGSYDRYKPAIQSGLPGFIGGADGSNGQLLDISRSTYLGADWNRFRSDVWSAFGELSHRFNDDWALRATGLVTSTRRKDNYSYIGSQPISDANEGWTNHIAYASDNSYWARSADVNLIGRFQMFGQDQSLILGADYQANNDKSYYTRLSNYARINVYDPVSPAEPPLNPYASSPPYETWDGRLVSQSIGGSQTDTKQFGAYGQISLSPLAGLTFVGGGRFTWWETQTRALLPTVAAYSGYKVKGRFTPYGGVVWDVTNSWNIYGSYADSFTPQTSTRRRPDGQAIKPLVGAQYEIGSKLSLFDEKLLLSVAGYQITQSNRLYTNDTELGPDIVLQIGKVRSRGIEAEIGGEVLPGWRVNGGYSYTKTKYLEDSNPLFEGLSFVPIIPKHSIKMFTNYAPETGPLAGFSIGGSVTWFTSTFGGNAATYRADNSLNARSTIVRQDAYIVADARAGYKFSDQLSLSVNVNNLFDRTYYSRISSTSRGNYFGSPRTVMATLRLAYP